MSRAPTSPDRMDDMDRIDEMDILKPWLQHRRPRVYRRTLEILLVGLAMACVSCAKRGHKATATAEPSASEINASAPAPPIPVETPEVEPEAPTETSTSLLAPGDSTGEIWIQMHFADRVEQCASGDDAACRQLVARTHFSTNDKESGRYFDAFETACEQGALSACGAIGRHLVSQGDKLNGQSMMATACRGDDPYACDMMAEAVLNDKTATDEDVKKARRELEGHCEELGSWPCMTLALVLLKEDKQNEKRAHRTMERACRTGDPIACYELGMRLAETSDSGEDAERITTLYRVGCEADFGQACYNLAWRYFQGRGADKDEPKGWELTVTACHLGDVRACDHLAQLEARDCDTPDEEAAVYFKYCNLWGANACYNTAAHLVRRRGESAKSAKDLVRLARQACNRGDAGGCNVLGHVARDYIGLCDKNEKVRDACAFAGYIHAVGIWLPKLSGTSIDADIPKAIEYLTRACEAGAEGACEERDRLKEENSGQ